MAGRPRKPTQLKIVAGTARKDREIASVNLPLVSEMPKPPDWLPNVHAIKEWDRLVPILMANKLLTEASTSALGMLCALHGKIVQIYAAGSVPTGHLLSQYRNLVNDFGLTPVAQSKVKPSSDGNGANPFQRNGKR